MTQEEKAKAYDEALNQAKFYHGNCPSEPERKKLEKMFPVLCESEDERIRKELIELVNELISEPGRSGITVGKAEKYLAYLEKQKDLDKMIVVSPEVWDKAIADAYENGKKDGEKQKEQKPYEPKNWPADKDNLTQEQKPAEWSAKGRRGRIGTTPEHIRKKAENFLSKMEPPYDADDICTAYEAGALESAKPVELEQLAKLREMTHEIRDAYERGIEVGRVESKQEWSEEDEDMLWNIISIVGQSKSIQADEMLDWLKSLRPQPKKELSIEKAIQWLDDTFYFLDNSSGRGPDYEITTHDFDSLEEMYDSFRKAVTVDSQPSWKPSEEQMKALEDAFRKDGSDEYRRTINSLYQDLKKLM